MELWNDYEGKTVDGRYRLERLIGPKGRSAFFTTVDEAGQPAVIRLIESLNDEEEILRRWRAVQAVKQENLLRILACDKTVLDGVHLVYAVMERADAELAEILRERALTADETREMARSVAAALEALHAKGLVHEHVEPANVVAQGELVKLRSDLVREAGEEADARPLRKRDAHDLAVLIQEAMTRRREGSPQAMPAPFDEMVRNGRSGAWGVSEMLAVVRPTPVVVPRAVSSPAPVAAAPVRGTAAGVSNRGGVVAGVAAAAAAAATAAKPSAATVKDVTLPTRAWSPEAGRIVMDPEDGGARRRQGLWAIAAVALLIVVLLFWHFLHTGRAVAGAGPVASAGPALSAPAVTTPSSGAPIATSSTAMPRANKPSAAVSGRDRSSSSQLPAPVVASAGAAAGTSGTDRSTQSAWRVVAFTYNRQEQAQQKVAALAQQHPDLQPEVFAPKGRAPYLVALGGWMSSGEATALCSKAHREGLPRDTYAQNYREH